MGKYILDLMIDNYRAQCLQRMCKGFKPSLPIKYVEKELSFDDSDYTITFMSKLGCIIEKDAIDKNQLIWNTKDSIIDITKVLSQNTKLLL